MYALNAAISDLIAKQVDTAKFDKTVSGVIKEVGEDTCVVDIDGAPHTLAKTLNVVAGQSVSVLKPLNTQNGREMKLISAEVFSKSDIIPLANGGTGQSSEAALKQFLGNLIYPVGAVYMSVDSTHPQVLFGGTWTAWGAGRVPVGIDSAQTEFDAAEETGGEKTHTLTIAEMPSHAHNMDRGRWWGNDSSIGGSDSIYNQNATTTS